MYKLTLTEQEYSDICFVGHRYAWSDTLRKRTHPGENLIEETTAWEITEAFADDNAMFPMLDPASDLYYKLINFWESVV